jgi:hypothetical protein
MRAVNLIFVGTRRAVSFLFDQTAIRDDYNASCAESIANFFKTGII